MRKQIFPPLNCPSSQKPKLAAVKNAKEYISSLLMKKFGISCTDVRIELDSDGDSVTVTGVCVTIDGGDAVTIKRWLDETLGGNVEVIYDRAV